MTVDAAVFFDARSADPTGTAGLRRSFRAAGKMRMNMFRSAMRQAVVEHDVLGLGGGGLAMQPPETRLQAFNGWARVAAGRALDGPWLSEWIARAWASGEAAGAAQTRSEAPGEGSGAWAELAKVELEAISFAVVQVITREAAVALTKRRANKVTVWRRMALAFDKVGPKRIMALANTFCVACHNRGRVAAYRAAGITQVGVVPEHLLPMQKLLLPGGLGDRLTHDDKHRGYHELGPARSQADLPEAEGGIEVGVRTAGDEYVCQACDDFAAGSPYDIDEVEDTLPMHVACRCTWFPWDDQRYSRDAVPSKSEREQTLERLMRRRHRALARMAPRRFRKPWRDDWDDEFNPNEPRDPDGKWTGAGGGSAGGDGHPGKGYSASARLIKGVIHTGSVYDAQRALFENRKVELKHIKEVSTLIERLGETARKMGELGQKAPLFNLCNVSVTGTNLFCAESKGIPRVEMPVIKAKKTKEFIKYLKSRGYKVEKSVERADHLRSTQDEIDGVKVAANMTRIDKEGFYKRIVVSRDDYILDGHHTWAGQLGVDARDGSLKGDKNVRIARIDISITKLLAEAETWTGGAGKKAAGQDAWNPNQPRVPAGSPEGGQFGEGGGASPHETETNKFERKGTADLKAQGFKPQSKGRGESQHAAALVAWYHAQKTGAPATAVITPRGWTILRGNEKVSLAQPHMVVTPEGVLHAYNPKPIGGEDKPIAGAGELTKALLITHDPRNEQYKLWGAQIEARQAELEQQGQAGGDEDNQLHYMKQALSEYGKSDIQSRDTDKIGLHAVYAYPDDDSTETQLLALTLVRYNPEQKVARITLSGGIDRDAHVKSLAMTVQRYGAKVDRIEGSHWGHDVETALRYEQAGFKAAGTGSTGLERMVYGKPEPTEQEKKAQAEAAAKVESERQAVVRQNARAAATVLDFDPNLVKFTDEDKTFKVGDREMHYAGSYSRGDNAVKIYYKNTSVGFAASCTAHEIGHRKFDALRARIRDERADMEKDPGPPPDPNHQYWWGRRGGKDAIMNPDGTLKPPYDTKYPYYNAWNTIDRDFMKMREADGVSDYSRQYWDAYVKGGQGVSLDSAYHETIAELTRIKFETLKLVGSKEWNQLYELMDKHWAGMTKTERELKQPISERAWW